MKFIFFIFLSFDFAKAECPKAYGFDQNGIFTEMKTRQESPLEPGKCLMPKRSTMLKPPKHTWKNPKFSEVLKVWELIEPPMPKNPDPEIYVKGADSNGKPIWIKDPLLVKKREDALKLLEEKVENYKQLKQNLNQQCSLLNTDDALKTMCDLILLKFE